MAVKASCNNPQQLLADINAGIRAGKIVTWELDSAGDITHTPEQWKHQAWFRPKVESGCLVFNILGRKSTKMTKEIYAVYHGRLIEMLLVHFDDKFSVVNSTALATTGDTI